MALSVGQSAQTGQLQTLATQMPVANQAVASGLQQARQTSLQQQIGGMAPGQATPTAVQTLGAQQAQKTGAIALSTQAQNQQEAGSLGKLGLQQQQQEATTSLGQRQLDNATKSRELTNQLASYNINMKNELVDQQLQFQKDELGRTVFNERQLADYTILKAQNDNAFRDYEQQVQDTSKKRLSILQMSQKKIEQALTESYQQNQQQLDDEQKMRLTQAQQALQQKIAQEKAKQSNMASMFQAGGTIVGGVVGAYFGGPAGAAAGAAIGSGVGSMAASQMSSQQQQDNQGGQ